jgi:TonB family protein
MTVPLNCSSIRAQVGVISSIGMLITFAGCAHAPLRHASSEAEMLSTNLTLPVPIHTVDAEYPFLLQSSGVEGRVDVSCLIDENGTVVQANILSAADADFASSAIQAAKEWRFAPGTHNQVPVPMRMVIPFHFNLEREDPRLSR